MCVASHLGRSRRAGASSRSSWPAKPIAPCACSRVKLGKSPRKVSSESPVCVVFQVRIGDVRPEFQTEASYCQVMVHGE